MATLVFNTTPPCANVSVYGKLYGKTPDLQIINVEANTYQYTIEFPGKPSYTDTIYVQRGKLTHIYVNLFTREKEEEVLNIGEQLSDFTSPSIPPSSQPPSTQPPSSQPPAPPQIPSPFDGGEPILVDEPLLADTPISISKHADYYDVANTIAVAGASDPGDFDSPVYNREEIYKIKGRYSEKIIVKNDGFVPLYIIVAHATSSTSWTKEVPLYSGEIKTYYNIYGIRLRSTVAGHAYRVMEYDLVFSIEKSELPFTLSTTSSVAGTSFGNALTQYQIQTIHIPGLVSNQIKIVAINGQSIQPLKYRLIFWSSATANNTDIDKDRFVTDVVMDFSDPLSAFQIDTGAGLIYQYYLDVSDLVGLYTDDDATVTLHMSLQNLSPVAKIAGALGAVQFDIKYGMKV